MKWKEKNARRRKNGVAEIFEVMVVEIFPVSIDRYHTPDLGRSENKRG